MTPITLGGATGPAAQQAPIVTSPELVVEGYTPDGYRIISGGTMVTKPLINPSDRLNVPPEIRAVQHPVQLNGHSAAVVGTHMVPPAHQTPQVVPPVQQAPPVQTNYPQKPTTTPSIPEITKSGGGWTGRYF